MMMMMNPNEMFMQLGSYIATFMFLRAIYEQYLPHPWRAFIHSFLYRYTEKIVRFFSPYLHITFEEYTGNRFNRSEAYTTIETYLSEKTSEKARGLKGNFVKDGKALVLALADNVEVTDEFQGVKVWWRCRKSFARTQTISFYPGTDERRNYHLTFHRRHRKLITESYLPHVLDEGKAIKIKKRQRKLHTNIKEQHGYYRSLNLWSHVEFKHPATFNTIAMEETKKKSIMGDLLRFSKAKEYYDNIGKPWKRGYLLYGPPGTGKSTMIAAIANLLEYDIYDLELTAVKDNTQLRRLLIETSNKSIIVIEDIDCSLDLTGQRSNSKEKENDGSKEGDEKEEIKKKLKENEGENKKSEVTLSGLLNFIDGLWSACGEERLIIFTTNYIEKLDPALIRRGRMDVHIELSYCCFEAFKILANNYLKVKNHSLFEKIKKLLEEIKVSPADVAENLMPKSLEVDVDECLMNLVKALEKAKEEEEKEKEKEREKQRMKVEEMEYVDNEEKDKKEDENRNEA